MSETLEFKPNWVSPPGDTILDLLSDRGLSISDFDNHKKDVSLDIERLLSGEMEIDDAVAKELASFFSTSKTFWINRDIQYRANDSAFVNQIDSITPIKWLSGFPVSEMIKMGWINADKSVSSRFKACLDFFGVSSIEDWDIQYKNKISTVLFKTSGTFEDKHRSTITWLRYGEICAEETVSEPWNADLLKNIIPRLLSLTRERCIHSAIQKAKVICSLCGVALIVAETPKNCHASGATFVTSNGKAVLMLSGRFRSDDHLWFSFFHEIGHLLLHGEQICDQIFLEFKDNDTTEKEREANKFANEVLIPKSRESEFNQLISAGKEIHNARRVMKFAKSIGISPGIVVGQLQHQKIITFKRLNRLKKKFSRHELTSFISNF